MQWQPLEEDRPHFRIDGKNIHELASHEHRRPAHLHGWLMERLDEKKATIAREAVKEITARSGSCWTWAWSTWPSTAVHAP
jgi:hypothetical protein